MAFKLSAQEVHCSFDPCLTMERKAQVQAHNQRRSSAVCILHVAEKKTPPRHPPLWTGLPHRHRTSNSSIAVIQYVTNLKSLIRLIHLHTHTYCVAIGMYQTIGWPHRQLGSKLQRSLQRVPHTCRKAAGCQCHLMT